jgi:DNA invertase Pin-like site-specific DNA recombinase
LSGAMKACIYARTSSSEKQHTTTKIEHQVAFCRDLAKRLNLTIEPEHVFTDVEMKGDIPPTCWVFEGDESRPALSALVEAIEQQGVQRVLVRRLEKLATSSDILIQLLELFESHDVYILADRDIALDDSDPSSTFAYSVLRPRVQFGTDEERDKTEKLKSRKSEEIKRLKAKIERLEAEMNDLD